MTEALVPPFPGGSSHIICTFICSTAFFSRRSSRDPRKLETYSSALVVGPSLYTETHYFRDGGIENGDEINDWLAFMPSSWWHACCMGVGKLLYTAGVAGGVQRGVLLLLVAMLFPRVVRMRKMFA